ncbi:JAB domain-containing protein [Escherichia coli]|uniref:JAB domain-containing protein n=1 Tax=Escherichia coli TaxID=562 RepID=UPI00085AA198|nr:JAB domain-containing protein [Escherichia coli]
MQQISFLPGEMTPGERSLIQRALKTLDRHLHEPGVAFTSTRAAREWLILNMAGLERHNHPSGEVTPSKADRLITERLVQALGLVDIRVPDHLIVGGNQVFSFAEHGLL